MLLDSALEALAALDTECVLLVDSADDVDAMAGLWPPGRNGSTLYTSRNPMLNDCPANAVCKIIEIENAEAVQLLLDAASLRPALVELVKLVEDIVATLSNLALAIDHASAYIARGECCIHYFLNTFKQHSASLLIVGAYHSASPYKRSVYATWELSHLAIESLSATELQQDPLVQEAQSAIQLLNMLAYFHYEHVTENNFLLAAKCQ
jgi:hypothetical protein